MKVTSELSPSFFPRGLCATIGNFDGVHAGHRLLIENAAKEAAERNLDFAAITFWPHPRQVLHSNHIPLSSLSSRRRLLAACGVPLLVELPFTHEFASLSAENFIEFWLLPARLRHLAVGHDFLMGHKRQGNRQLLTELSRKNGFTLSRLPVLQIDGQTVSSSLLRQLLADGQVAKAARMLGRFYSVEGEIEAGTARGRKMGFPTANLGQIHTLLPKDGVYATIAHIDGKAFAAVTNIGKNPTFNAAARTVETFLLDASGDFYGKNMTLDFVDRLRDEKRFEDMDSLSAQIALDAAKARTLAEAFIQ